MNKFLVNNLQEVEHRRCESLLLV